jgi:hypothetical protein
MSASVRDRSTSGPENRILKLPENFHIFNIFCKMVSVICILLSQSGRYRIYLIPICLAEQLRARAHLTYLFRLRYAET